MEYRSNSHKSREEQSNPVPEKKIEKIISGSVRSKKKGGMQKLANVFISDDIDDVKSYIFEDIVVPAVKDIILDAVKAVLGVNRTYKGTSVTADKVSYRKYYNDRDRRESNVIPRTRRTYDYDDKIVDNRGEAEKVLLCMDEMIATYGLASVADYYDLLGITGNYTDNKYGWTDLRDAAIVRVDDGYLIKLPKVKPLN